VALSILDGQLRYSGEAQAVAAVLPLLREHKPAIIRELTITESLLSRGYPTPEWTPAGCRAFLSELMREWSDFHVNGWHGLTMPECWPVALMDAVQAVYVQSLQD
jgi:hypothetical protein